MSEPQSKATRLVLTINTGSSSLKSAVHAIGAKDPQLVDAFEVDRIGLSNVDCLDFTSAITGVIADLEKHQFLSEIVAVGHRIVTGGARHSAPERASDALLSDLRALFPIDPEHLPQAVAAVEAISDRLPELPQVACFDTHFHDSMPITSRLLPLPRWLAEEGVRRFGFHGLSYESIVRQLTEIDPVAARGRVVIAHLGSGASMAAVREGESIDTTMGFTPSGGLMMGTRTGDLDPGVLLYLLQVLKLTPPEINVLFNKGSGLLGVSGTSQDVRDLLAVEATDERARETLALFCHIAKKHLAGLVAVLGGIDSLVFTGGIGEHSAAIRGRIAAGLEFMNIKIDPDRNSAHAPVISPTHAQVTVRVMKTDEALIVARHTAELIQI